MANRINPNSGQNSDPKGADNSYRVRSDQVSSNFHSFEKKRVNIR